jgi:hypothetical protein
VDEKQIESVPEKKYSGNDYDLYAVIAGTLGGSTLLMCMSFNMALYCLPIVPLVLGIIALRRANSSVDPGRTRNLALLGIAGGGMGILFLLAMIVLMIVYLCFIFAMFGLFAQSGLRR